MKRMHSCHKFSIYHCFLFMINILSNWECQEGQSSLPTFFGNNLRKSIIVSMDGKNNYCPVNQWLKVCSFNQTFSCFTILKLASHCSVRSSPKTCPLPLSFSIHLKNCPVLSYPHLTHTRTDTVRSSHKLLHTHTVRFPPHIPRLPTRLLPHPHPH